MDAYRSIPNVYKRSQHDKRLIEGVFSTPEIDYLKDAEWIFTEKIDGANIRLKFKDGEFEIAGREDASQVPMPLFKYLTSLCDDLKDKVPSVFKADDNKQYDDLSFCLYGEGYGPGIQKVGKRYRDSPGFILFDVKIGQWWLKRGDVIDIAHKFDIDTVNVLLVCDIETAVRYVSTGQTSAISYDPELIAEGIVGTPKVPLLDHAGDRIMVKIKHRDFTKSRGFSKYTE